jgi:hypothetical protein
MELNIPRAMPWAVALSALQADENQLSKLLSYFRI